MKYFKILFLAVVSFSFISCQTMQSPAPLALNDKSSGIAIAAYTTERGNTRQFKKIYLVKLDKNADENALFTRTNIIHTNFIRGNYIYLLNAEPGDYVAVGGHYGQDSSNTSTKSSSGGFSLGGVSISSASSSGTSSSRNGKGEGKRIVYFSKEMIKSTKVTVAESQMAFMGEYQVQTKQIKTPDVAQMHYYKVVEPEKRGKTSFMGVGLRNFVMGAVSGSGSATNSQQGKARRAVRNKDSEMRFLKTAEDDLKGGGWADRIQNQKIDLLVGKPGGSF